MSFCERVKEREESTGKLKSLYTGTNTEMRRVFSIGLTGGIASGKSSARALLKDHGARVIDADKLGHACYAAGHPCLAQVVAAFGAENILDDGGTLDDAKLGGIVFSDPQQLQKLNGIVWPHIRASLQSVLDGISAEVMATASGSSAPGATDQTIIVCEAAVLVEAGWQDLFDEIWVVRLT